MAEEVRDYIEKIFAKNPLKIVVSKAVSKDVRYRKITVVRKEKGYQIERLTQKRRSMRMYLRGMSRSL